MTSPPPHLVIDYAARLAASRGEPLHAGHVGEALAHRAAVERTHAVYGSKPHPLLALHATVTRVLAGRGLAKPPPPKKKARAKSPPPKSAKEMNLLELLQRNAKLRKQHGGSTNPTPHSFGG